MVKVKGIGSKTSLNLPAEGFLLDIKESETEKSPLVFDIENDVLEYIQDQTLRQKSYEI